MDEKFLSSKELLHMLFHILGRYHEHERPDKEEYIKVIEENIIEGTQIVTNNTAFLTTYNVQFRKHFQH